MSTKRKAPAKLLPPAVRPSATAPSKTTINEAATAVSASHSGAAAQVEAIEISSDSESDLSDEVTSDADDAPTAPSHRPVAASALTSKHQSTPNGNVDANQLPSPESPNGHDVDADADASEAEGEAEAEPDEEPAFGELIQHQEIIDVQAALAQPSDESRSQLQTLSRSIAPPSLSSLGTVLAQALRTDDTDLLESCLHTTDLPTIQHTIERLDSSLVGILLEKLASRLHRRPGRAGWLMTWIQWSLVAHGGALASQPAVLEKLEALQKALAERARGLTSLLILKGKLDLLEAQMQLRRGAAQRQRRHAGLEDDEDDDEEAGLIWVEGEDEDQPGTSTKRKAIEADADEGMLPATNGILGDSDDDDDSDEVSEGNESEESGSEDDADEDDVDYDDVDDVMGEDDDSDVEAAPPPAKVQKVGATFSKKR